MLKDKIEKKNQLSKEKKLESIKSICQINDPVMRLE
jgi:hypothetical protein